MLKNRLWTVLAMLIIALVITSCGDSGGSPTGPTGQTQAPPVASSNPAPPTNPAPPPTPGPNPGPGPGPSGPGPGPVVSPLSPTLCEFMRQGVYCEVLEFSKLSHGVIRLHNAGTQDMQACFDVMKRYLPDSFDTQVRDEQRSKCGQVPFGGSIVLRVEFPSCFAQVDVVVGEIVRKAPHPVDRLIGHEMVGGPGFCNEPIPPPPPPTVDVCEAKKITVDVTSVNTDPSNFMVDVKIDWIGEGNPTLHSGDARIVPVKKGEVVRISYPRTGNGEYTLIFTLDVAGKVCSQTAQVKEQPFVPPPPAVTCLDLNLKVDVVSTLLVDNLVWEVKPVWSPVAGSPATGIIKWGDGASNTVTNGVMVSHSFVREFLEKNYVLNLETRLGEQICSKQVNVNVPPRDPTQCPVVTRSNHEQYVSKEVIIGEGGVAYTNFTVTVPVGCRVLLSLVSYQIPLENGCELFPQKFIGGRSRSYESGTYTRQLEVPLAPTRPQVDLYAGGFKVEDLTAANEAADYGPRTLEWYPKDPLPGCVR